MNLKPLFLKKIKINVFKWANKINNKSYVGSSVKLNRRFSEYFCLDKNKTFIGNSYKNNAILK